MPSFKRLVSTFLPVVWLSVAQAGGQEPGAAFPALTLMAGQLSVRYAPTVHTELQGVLPRHLEGRVRVPGMKTDVLVTVHAVEALRVASRMDHRLWRQVEVLQRINAGTLDPHTLTVHTGSQTSPDTSLPYLYNPFVMQWAAGAVKQLSLPNGVRGIRYVALRGGDIGFYSADMAEYTYQGLSRDGQFYISVSTAYQPAGIPTRAQVNAQYTLTQRRYSASALYDADAQRLKTQLDATTNAEPLRRLDALIQSIVLR
ncbi:hypothetical protein [Deinococcus daejeonensis]|uniref:Uncharacterized protein n=1 Tax=Deinococcus daejeonensis TaxID=1007098 RepID=A0ABQ2J9Y8_9DEIO|nr:hypothetical protein [Deinococcus daejeonensis]GGN43286.1 hypothetical protein GCM10010842_30580 [Deinococcus daejeonensis]